MLMQMPGPRDIVIIGPAPGHFLLCKSRGAGQKPRGARGGWLPVKLIPAELSLHCAHRRDCFLPIQFSMSATRYRMGSNGYTQGAKEQA